MGVNIKNLLVRKEIAFTSLSNKKLAVDSFNVLYQFLSTIRQRDGSLLTDSQGNVTSHLTGLFSRTMRLLQYGMKPAFVFDGVAPKLKEAERARRKSLKLGALEKHKVAEREGNIDDMKKYASRTSVLNGEMIKESKALITALGLPTIQAPSEGEAQAAAMVANGDLYAEISQDYDCLMFGVPRMVQNLTISPRKKLPNKLSYEKISPIMIDLQDNLSSLGISRDQLIALGMLVGTDFNVGGVKGIGPKNALKIVKEFGENFSELFEKVEWDNYFDFSWETVFDTIKKMPVTNDYSLKWNPVDREKVIELLVEQHEFSRDRITSSLDKLDNELKKHSQKGLSDFF